MVFKVEFGIAQGKTYMKLIDYNCQKTNHDCELLHYRKG